MTLQPGHRAPRPVRHGQGRRTACQPEASTEPQHGVPLRESNQPLLASQLDGTPPPGRDRAPPDQDGHRVWAWACSHHRHMAAVGGLTEVGPSAWGSG